MFSVQISKPPTLYLLVIVWIDFTFSIISDGYFPAWDEDCVYDGIQA